MGVRKLGACHACVLWRGESGEILAERPPLSGRAAEDATGACHRRVQTGEDGQFPRQPVTPYFGGCSEAIPLPAPPRLPADCADCRFWRELPRERGLREGLCLVWAPRWSYLPGGRAGGRAVVPETSAAGPARYSWPVTAADFVCGDGVSTSHKDPEELEEGEDEG